MSEINFENGPSISLGAYCKKREIKELVRFFAPPHDGRCKACGKHISQLKPFGGPGDPLDGDFSGELLVMRWRHLCRYDETVEAAEKAWQEAEKSVPDQKDIIPWLISKYGEDEADNIFGLCEVYAMILPRWECRDCIGLSDEESFEAFDKRCEENKSQ